VVGGCFDEEFAESCVALFQQAREGHLVLLVSDVLLDELAGAPLNLREVLDTIPADSLERIEVGDSARQLHDAYLRARIVGKRSSNDAFHVALASVAGADVFVSWNCKHIVRLQKIRGFNAVNLANGFEAIEIRTPQEIV
jgi:predicted nucleic acid-binding protein